MSEGWEETSVGTPEVLSSENMKSQSPNNFDDERTTVSPNHWMMGKRGPLIHLSS
jgi:hypothetical protein